MHPKKLQFPVCKKENVEAWCKPEGKLISTKEISHSSDLLDHFAEETRVETMLGGTTPRQDRLVKHTLALLFKPKPHVKTLKMDLGGEGMSLYLFICSSQCVHTE